MSARVLSRVIVPFCLREQLLYFLVGAVKMSDRIIREMMGL